MPRSRPLRAVAVTAGLAVFGTLAFVFPAVHDRIEQDAAAAVPAATAALSDPSVAPTATGTGTVDTTGTATSSDTGGVADPAVHPAPTAEQDRIYDDQTRRLAPHPGLAVEGRDGYLFLGDTFIGNFAQATGREYYSPEQVKALTAEVSDQRAWLAAAGIGSEFVVVPAKWSVYPDKMPDWTDGSQLPHILDQLIARQPADFPDLRPALRLARSVGPTYSRLNSHWTEYGAWAGWSAIARLLESDVPGLGSVPVPPVSGASVQDLNNEFAGITGAAGPNDWAVPSYLSPPTPFTVTATDGTTTENPGDQLIDTSTAPFVLTNPAAPVQRRVLVLADSATVMLTPLLGATFGTVSVVRHFRDQPEKSPNVPTLIEQFQPELVITLLSERNLGVLKADPYTYGAALAFDRNTVTAGSWTPGAATGGIGVEGATDAGGTVLTGLPPGPLVLRMDVDAPAAVTATLGGVGVGDSTTGASTVPLAAGANVVYRSLPAGFAGGNLTVGAADGSAVTVTALELRTPS